MKILDAPQTNPLPRLVKIREHDEDAASEGKNPEERSRDEHLRVEAEPSEVHRHFVAEVTPDDVQRLGLVPLLELRPLQVQQLEAEELRL